MRSQQFIKDLHTGKSIILLENPIEMNGKINQQFIPVNASGVPESKFHSNITGFVNYDNRIRQSHIKKDYSMLPTDGCEKIMKKRPPEYFFQSMKKSRRFLPVARYLVKDENMVCEHYSPRKPTVHSLKKTAKGTFKV